MDLLQSLRAQARANALANHRLHAAMAPLTRDEFHAPRTSFFPSLAATLNHLLAVDIYYLDALHGVTDMVANYRAFVPDDTLAELAARQRASDMRLIALCDTLQAGDLDRVVDLDRGTHVEHEIAPRVLAHLFMHQTHHRGQVHAMLSGAAVEPPQLDEFLLASDASRRPQELAAFGWCEADLLGERPG